MTEGVSAAIGGKLYVLIGCNNFDHCLTFTPLAFFRYDPVTNRWTALALPAHRHQEGAAGVIGGKFYVTGGFTDGTVNPDLEVYDPATNQWTTRAPLPRNRSGSASVVVGGRLYVIGGFGDRVGLGTANIVYDPATDRWLSKAPVPHLIPGPAGGRVLVDGQPRIEIVGADGNNNLEFTP